MDSINKIAMRLIQSRDIIHLTHLASLSYSEHIALDSYYKDIVEIFDRLIESSQGLTQTLEDIKLPVSSKVDSPIDYLRSLDAFIERNKRGLRSFQIAILDDAQELINETIYKLKFLK